MTSLDELFADIAARGYRVNNIFQWPNGLWRVNLLRPNTNGDWFGDFAEAPTLAEAIEDAIALMNDAEFIHHDEPTWSLDKSKPAAPNLLKSLGLLKPQEPIRRRI